MNDSREISLSGARNRHSWFRALAVVVILLLLLLFGLALFWPVPDEDLDVRQGFTRPPAEAGTVSIVDATTRIAHEVPLGRRAIPLAVSVAVDNAGQARAFDSNWIRLEINQVTLLPLSEGREGVSLVSWAPREIEEGLSEAITVVFAVPVDSTEATVVVQTGEVRPEDASRMAVKIPEEAER
ncbi:MAG: hypothetical protein KGZ89_04130 [Actinobacteria bacterium]|nr:hypothetical protein [Actinomycetota bacterium]